MKKALFILGFIAAAWAGKAQDCKTIITATGNTRTQVQKATCHTANKEVTATVWLSRDNNGYYINIAAAAKDNQPFNIKAQPGERVLLTFADGNVLESRMIKKTGNSVAITINDDMARSIATIPAESIAWYENNAMEPSLLLPVDDWASQLLSQAAGCLK
jgi:hypothetical protein